MVSCNEAAAPPPPNRQGDACLAGARNSADDPARAELVGQGPLVMAGLRVRMGINTGESGRPANTPRWHAC